MAYIANDSKPINATTYSTSEEAVADFIKPAWAGASPTEITMISDTTFNHRGIIYTIVGGENPTQARREARAAQPGKSTGRGHREYKGSRWLSREMDRADSDY